MRPFSILISQYGPKEIHRYEKISMYPISRVYCVQSAPSDRTKRKENSQYVEENQYLSQPPPHITHPIGVSYTGPVVLNGHARLPFNTTPRFRVIFQNYPILLSHPHPQTACKHAHNIALYRFDFENGEINP